MPIIFHEQSKTFHLYNRQISYIFKVLKNGSLGQLYFGKRIHDKECNSFFKLFLIYTITIIFMLNWKVKFHFQKKNLKVEISCAETVLTGKISAVFIVKFSIWGTMFIEIDKK